MGLQFTPAEGGNVFTRLLIGWLAGLCKNLLEKKYWIFICNPTQYNNTSHNAFVEYIRYNWPDTSYHPEIFCSSWW